MDEPVPYGLTAKQLEQATPAAQAVAARLAHIVIETEWWGQVAISNVFLNMTLLREIPSPEGRRKMYHRVCRPVFETPLFEGLDALDLDAMPADQREAVQQMRDYRAWRIEADRQHEGQKAQPS